MNMTRKNKKKYHEQPRGGSRFSGKEVHMYKGVCGEVALLFYLIFLEYPIKMK